MTTGALVVLAGLMLTATTEDRKVCREKNPGPPMVVYKAYLACLDERDRVAKEARDSQRRTEEAAAQAAADEREARERAAREQRDRLAAEQWQRENDERNRRAAEEQAKVAAEEEALRKKCGRDYGRMAVGMKWARVQQCSGSFALVRQDAAGSVYESGDWLVRVQNGVVVTWQVRR